MRLLLQGHRVCTSMLTNTYPAYSQHNQGRGNKDYEKLLSQIPAELYRTKESHLSSPWVISLKNSKDLLRTTATLELLEVRPHSRSNQRAVQQAAVISPCADCRPVGLQEYSHTTLVTFIEEGNKGSTARQKTATKKTDREKTPPLARSEHIYSK